MSTPRHAADWINAVFSESRVRRSHVLTPSATGLPCERCGARGVQKGSFSLLRQRYLLALAKMLRFPTASAPPDTVLNKVQPGGYSHSRRLPPRSSDRSAQ